MDTKTFISFCNSSSSNFENYPQTIWNPLYLELREKKEDKIQLGIPYVIIIIMIIILHLSDCNGTRTLNHLVRKETFNHLAQLASFRLGTRWLWVRVPLQSLKLQILHLFE